MMAIRRSENAVFEMLQCFQEAGRWGGVGRGALLVGQAALAHRVAQEYFHKWLYAIGAK